MLWEATHSALPRGRPPLGSSLVWTIALRPVHRRAGEAPRSHLCACRSMQLNVAIYFGKRVLGMYFHF